MHKAPGTEQNQRVETPTESKAKGETLTFMVDVGSAPRSWRQSVCRWDGSGKSAVSQAAVIQDGRRANDVARSILRCNALARLNT